MKRFLLATAILLGLSPLAISPSQAATYPIISGRVVDMNGDPVSNVQVTVVSGTLRTFKCTGVDGKYSVRTRANSTVTIGLNRCVALNGLARTGDFGNMPTPATATQFGGTSTLTVTTTNVVHNITLQARKLDIKITARDTDGNLVAGNAFAEYTSALVFEGVGGRAYDAWGASSFINTSGVIELFTFKPATDLATWSAVAQEWPEIQIYLSNLDHIGIPDNDQDGHSDGIRVTYLSAPGVEQSIWVPAIEWTTGSAEVVFDAVPEIAVSTPSSVAANKTSYASITVTPSLLTSLRGVASSGNQSAAVSFKGKTVKLYSRTVLKNNKFGKWTYEGSCKLTSAGKCKAKFKISKKSQLQFRAVDLTLPIKTKTVKIK